MATQMKFYSIYSLDPDENGDEEYRLVEMFESEEDANYVLSALEKVNVMSNTYRLQEMIVDM